MEKDCDLGALTYYWFIKNTLINILSYFNKHKLLNVFNETKTNNEFKLSHLY